MQQRSRGLVIAIGVFKLVKVVALLAGAVGLFELTSGDTRDILAHWGHALGLDPSGGLLHPVFARLGDTSHRALGLGGIALVAYAIVFAVEAYGLLRDRPWGEKLTIVITASFLPFELVEAIRDVSAPRVAALVLNAAIVAYLVARVRKT